MTQSVGKKSGTSCISYEFKKVTGQIVNFRQIGSKMVGVGYSTILLRDKNGAEYLLHNVQVSHSLDPFLRAAKGQITIAYLYGEGDGKNDKPFGCILALVTADGKTHADIALVYTFTRGMRAQVRLPYYDLLKGGVAACIIMIGFPIVGYAVWCLLNLKTPVLTEDYARREIKKLGVVVI